MESKGNLGFVFPVSFLCSSRIFTWAGEQRVHFHFMTKGSMKPLTKLTLDLSDTIDAFGGRSERTPGAHSE